MDRIISDLRQEAATVLFDSPPIVAVTDAAILARKVDGVVLVVSIGRTKRDHAVRAREILEKANVRVLGAVLNNVKMDSSLHRYYSS
jgi:non-specific protein-tyrosine kinase